MTNPPEKITDDLWICRRTIGGTASGDHDGNTCYEIYTPVAQYVAVTDGQRAILDKIEYDVAHGKYTAPSLFTVMRLMAQAPAPEVTVEENVLKSLQRTIAYVNGLGNSTAKEDRDRKHTLAGIAFLEWMDNNGELK